MAGTGSASIPLINLRILHWDCLFFPLSKSNNRRGILGTKSMTLKQKWSVGPLSVLVGDIVLYIAMIGMYVSIFAASPDKAPEYESEFSRKWHEMHPVGTISRRRSALLPA